MKIAVLMSTYNAHKYLNLQLESLANQTLRNDMIVYIRDDGSTDNTFKIIENWREKINITLYKGSNIGPAMSFWELLISPQIQADYYAFCDQDDIWDKDKIETGIQNLKGNTHFYACNCRIIDENGITTKELRQTKPPQINIKRLFISGCTQGCSMIFTDSLRKYIIEKKIQCIPMHDVVLMLYAMQFGTIYWDQSPHFGYRVHSNNVVAKNNKTKFQKIKTIWWNWKNTSHNSMATVAKELIKNVNNLKADDLEYLNCIKNYKSDFTSKWKILTDNSNDEIDKSAVCSYKIRLLLNLF